MPNLKTITIPKKVTKINYSPFSLSPKLTEIKVEEGNANYVSKDGVLYDKAEAT